MGKGLTQIEAFILQLDPDFGNSFVRQKRVAQIEFCQNPTIRGKLLRTQELIL